MKLKKSVPTFVLGALILGSVVGVSVANAQENGIRSKLAQKIAERFNLDQNEVGQFLQNERQARQGEYKSQLEERLSGAVTNGSLTEEQKQALLAKLEELKVNKGELKDLSSEERRDAIEIQRQELQNWADENGIDLNELSLKEKGFGRLKHNPIN